MAVASRASGKPKISSGAVEGEWRWPRVEVSMHRAKVSKLEVNGNGIEGEQLSCRAEVSKLEVSGDGIKRSSSGSGVEGERRWH